MFWYKHLEDGDEVDLDIAGGRFEPAVFVCPSDGSSHEHILSPGRRPLHFHLKSGGTTTLRPTDSAICAKIAVPGSKTGHVHFDCFVFTLNAVYFETIWKKMRAWSILVTKRFTFLIRCYSPEHATQAQRESADFERTLQLVYFANTNGGTAYSFVIRLSM